jgi:small-conductance mechanosensitive channel
VARAVLRTRRTPLTVIPLEPGARRILLASLLAALSLPALPALASQATPDGQAAQAPSDPESADVPAPVTLGGETIVWVTAPAGPYGTEFRADRISRRLLEIVRDRSIPNPVVTVTEAEESSELRVGPRLLMVVTAQDAKTLGTARAALAQHYARELEAAIRAERVRYAPATLVRSGIYGLVATLMLVLTIWLIQRFTRAIHGVIVSRRSGRHGALRVQQAEIVSADRVGRAIRRSIRAIRVVLLLLVVDVYLTYVLGLFPWTRAVSLKLLDYVVTPIRAAAAAFVDYLPKLLFVVVITGIIYAAIRLVGLFFDQIRQGRIVFKTFPAEWADPTNKIVRVLLIAFGIVVAFPYLPASGSPAFAGVSVFMGVLISLASSSALSNMIAGIVLTYTNAFRLGDRVRVGDTFGDIVETALLATHIRTIKNEDVTLPNSVVLSSSVINYSRAANTLGLILHTSVTIGYDAPWRKVHGLLIDAALATPGILREPAPFVWQTALNDFYVTYEINAYTNIPRDMIDIYAALHARIQDEFYAAGVEIMSPHYTSLRDGNAVAIPETLRPPEYRPPAFRLEDVAPPSPSDTVRSHTQK